MNQLANSKSLTRSKQRGDNRKEKKKLERNARAFFVSVVNCRLAPFKSLQEVLSEAKQVKDVNVSVTIVVKPCIEFGVR